ncbi:MAG: hypothetical protein CMH55_11360 [Myxococcales bacterium]|nr:hypothetical protein [Myxococcales bacterium]
MRVILLFVPIFLLGCPQEIQDVKYTLGYEAALDKAVRNNEIKRVETSKIIAYIQATGEEDPSLRQHTYGELSELAKAWEAKFQERLKGLKARYEKGCRQALDTFTAEVDRCLGATMGQTLVLKPLVKEAVPKCQTLLGQAEDSNSARPSETLDALKAAIQACERAVAKRKAWYDKEMATKYNKNCEEAARGFGVATYDE